MAVCKRQEKRSRRVEAKFGHVYVQDHMNAVRFPSLMLLVVVNHHAGAVDKLPPTLDRNRARTTEYKVYAVHADARLEYGVTNEALERKIFVHPVHTLKPSNVCVSAAAAHDRTDRRR